MLVAGCILLFTPSFSTAQDTTHTQLQFTRLIESLKNASDAANREEIALLAHDFEEYFKDADIQKFARYYSAFAWYTLYNLSEYDGIKPDKKWLDASIAHLLKAIEIDPAFADAYALLAAEYGIKAGGLFSGMKYGPKSERVLQKAKELAPENPRVYLIEGIGEIYKPKIFGGGLEHALQSFEKAAKLFETYKPDSELDPQWGEAQVYAWIGQVYVKQNKRPEARKAYQKALEINPNYYWVKEKLLPEIAK
jgi:tetratricopeptide (TPR) repeat protein